MLNLDDNKDTEQQQQPLGAFGSFRTDFIRQIKSYGLKKAVKESTKEDKTTFIQDLWDRCLAAGLPQLAVETKWIQGIKNGDLNPNNYGRYTVQDVGYCQRATDNWKIAKDKSKDYDQDIYQYCSDQVKSMIRYTAELSNSWHVTPDGVVLGDALDKYMDYEEYIVNNYQPPYFLVAMYACYYLWPWVCQEIGEPAKTNLYYGWWDDNRWFDAGDALGAKIDEMYDDGKIDKDIAFEVLSVCIKGETNFWRSACDEVLLDIIDECVVLFNDNNGWKFETNQQDVAKKCYENPKDYTTIKDVDNVTKSLVINKKVIESNKASTDEGKQFLIGKAVSESYLDIEDSLVYQTDIKAKNIVSYVLFHDPKKGPQIFKSDDQMAIDNKYKDISLDYAKVIITVKEDLTVEITSQSGYSNYILICIGAWYLNQFT